MLRRRNSITTIGALILSAALATSDMGEVAAQPPADFLLSFDHGMKVMFAQQFRVFCGGGIPDNQRNELIREDYNAPGVSGQSWDQCFRIHDNGRPIPQYEQNTYFGVTLNFQPGGLQGVNLAPYKQLSMDVRVGSADSYADWAVRIEDTLGSREWENKTIPLPKLTTSFQRVTVPLEEFTNPLRDGDMPDLQQAASLVFAAVGLNEASGPFPVDLQIDNIRITAAAAVDPSQKPEILFFYHPDIVLSQQMDAWFASGAGRTVSNAASIRKIDVSVDTESARQFQVYRVPALIVTKPDGSPSKQIQYTGDYDKFCQELEATSGLRIHAAR